MRCLDEIGQIPLPDLNMEPSPHDTLEWGWGLTLRGNALAQRGRPRSALKVSHVTICQLQALFESRFIV